MKRALISVSDKTGVVEFAKGLIANGFEIISTGGTYKKLQENGVEVLEIDEVTQFPEILDGRVKTLHPMVHAGLLAKRDNPEHMKTLEDLNIQTIDLVCVNLYPFKETISKDGVTPAEAIEQIDIGGPSMIRSASKNFKSVYVVIDANDYETVLESLQSDEDDTILRRRLAAKAFRHTAEYDSIIGHYLTDLNGDEFPDVEVLGYDYHQELRYGENSHQKAAFYKSAMPSEYSIASAKQLHGKELSFNNIKDADAALRIVADFDQPCVAALKHMNPCGVGVDDECIYKAWRKAYTADTMSIFGGIVAVNREVTKEIAEEMHKIFLEIVIAPSFTDEALEILEAKKNIRLLTLDFSKAKDAEKHEYVSVMGGLLVQERDTTVDQLSEFEVVTKKAPTDEEMKALLFGQQVVKHVKSNAIVITTTDKTLGIGAGQMNRIGSVKIAIDQEEQADTHTPLIMASDAFFPMDDCVQYAAEHGITAIVQPGGSIKDQDSIDMADKHGIAMVFTGRRHFKH
ncbi:bifunctional phosphoribosylaminoimidazolecarboxamide formyltransferase/IMP cyclohydrolase [Companilactobacillus zhachilii]|uniref:bifunctional phosphoribosylaminoimidazolecarboxamide formyltransferase/IMP cyclohydrolase n=1 Tax=Companilactobacillus zhachilii TaxID=2304606 RepID=UPI0019216EB6|nr:bifunctional phosphoribosylaminoimidazolecarboxamide formyltransferase/IMP cyclohydrolase [Companilactobacillus zhachilii]MBL3529904.1 bifunctional phosphoribosylaminoimidazolecarboxamide formyltransferase/IMP cyclohydrolase [Companilactobacillus zhachilii]